MAMTRPLPAALFLLFLPLLAGGAAAEDAPLRVAAADCARLVRHVPAPDVAYRPGVDVYGRPVTPADLDAANVTIPETILILITVDLQERFGIPANSILFEGNAGIGVVAVDGDRVTFNGRELTDPETRALAAACQRIDGAE